MCYEAAARPAWPAVWFATLAVDVFCKESEGAEVSMAVCFTSNTRHLAGLGQLRNSTARELSTDSEQESKKKAPSRSIAGSKEGDTPPKTRHLAGRRQRGESQQKGSTNSSSPSREAARTLSGRDAGSLL